MRAFIHSIPTLLRRLLFFAQVHRIICVPDPGRMPARWSFTAEENLVGIVHHTEARSAARMAQFRWYSLHPLKSGCTPVTHGRVAS